MFLITAFIVIAAVLVGEYEQKVYAAREKEAAQVLLDDLHSPSTHQQ